MRTVFVLPAIALGLVACAQNTVSPPSAAAAAGTCGTDASTLVPAGVQITEAVADIELAGFRARNGKLLFAHGLADPIFSPDEMVDYYQRLSARHGAATADFSRLFLIPGMAHCAGGAATDSWDGLGAWVDWVEKGQPPQRIVAHGTTVFPGRSRPLCPYPAYAHYDGGNVEDAASFSCRTPARP